MSYLRSQGCVPPLLTFDEVNVILACALEWPLAPWSAPDCVVFARFRSPRPHNVKSLLGNVQKRRPWLKELGLEGTGGTR